MKINKFNKNLLILSGDDDEIRCLILFDMHNMCVVNKVLSTGFGCYQSVIRIDKFGKFYNEDYDIDENDKYT
jgi:hypothetical protein